MIAPADAARQVSKAIRENATRPNLRRRFDNYKQARGVIAVYFRSRAQGRVQTSASATKRLTRAKKTIAVWEADMASFKDIGQSNRTGPKLRKRLAESTQ